MASYPKRVYPALTSTIEVDPAGDLRLLVQHGEQQIIFQVSSKAMSLASPVWRTMLEPAGPFKESQSDSGEIAFPDDDSEALLILLLACHLRFQDIPQELWYEQFLNVCILCDKYDCIALIRPWISRWQAHQLHLAGPVIHGEWLFICWTTGDQATFERVARYYVKTSLADVWKQFIDRPKLLDAAIPPGILGLPWSLPLPGNSTNKLAESIFEARLQTLTKLIELSYSLANRRGPNKQSLHCVSNDADSSEACDDLSVGSMTRQLEAIESPVALWPGVPGDIASRYNQTVETLSRHLQNMVCNIYPRGHHKHCGFVAALDDGVKKILADIPSGMDDSHRRHMATQRSKLSQSHSLLGQLGRPRQPPPLKEKR